MELVLVLAVCLGWIFILTLHQSGALLEVLILAEYCGRDSREDVRKGRVGLVIQTLFWHCLIQESISGSWVLFPRGRMDLLSLCIPWGCGTMLSPKVGTAPEAEEALTAPPGTALGQGAHLDSAKWISLPPVWDSPCV